MYKSYVTYSMMLHVKMVSRILDGPGNTNEKRKMSGWGVGGVCGWDMFSDMCSGDNCALLGYYAASSGNS